MPCPTTTIRFDIAVPPSSDEAMSGESNVHATRHLGALLQVAARLACPASVRCRGPREVPQMRAPGGQMVLAVLPMRFARPFEPRARLARERECVEPPGDGPAGDEPASEIAAERVVEIPLRDAKRRERADEDSQDR